MATRSKRLRGDDADALLPVDPSLMTERQQLAFLLRKTAQESGVEAEHQSSSSPSESSSDDEAPRRASKKKRKPAAPAPKTSPKSPPPATRQDLIAAALKNPAGLVLYCGRGRPPKNAIKLAPGEEIPPDLKRLVETAASHLRRNGNEEQGAAVKDLHVKTSDDEKMDESKNHHHHHHAARTTSKTLQGKAREKTSPSSTSDLSHMQVFDDRGEFWNTQCALCSHSNSPFDVPLEALFLCPTCDRKYPTQRALGLV